ncbi:LTA synthase family protein [Clostridium amazonitimonense]|uniref:LTA synthase family protein n=1 Tax=Clostridium amazonitimonense TaxID=1499689 RepID=UPI0005098404|nr:LTA synthase family protein [Clostridium amazonitimonense]
MIYYTKNSKKHNLLNSIKSSFNKIVGNKLFLYTYIFILLKSILFILLISHDKANGIVPIRIFYSVPPFLLYLSFVAVVVSFGFLFKGKAQMVLFWIINLFITALYIFDIWYFRSNSAFLNIHMFKMTSNLENLGSSIISMVRLVDILFIIDLILQIPLSIKLKEKFKNNERSISSFLLLFVISTLYITYAHYKIDILNKGFENQMVFQKSWSPNQNISNLTPIGYHLFDTYYSYKDSKPYVLSDSEKSETEKWFKDNKEVLPPNEYSGIFEGKNLLLIQWESLETFVINQKVDNQEITPNMNNILKNSIYFDNFYEQTHHGTSSDAELITHTSVFPVRSGSTFFRYPNNTYKNSFPNVMSKLGYTTLASHPDKGSFWNWMPALKSIGFENVMDSNDYNVDEVLNLGLSDKSYLNQFAEVIKDLNTPFFAYTVTLTSHTPFILPEEYRDLNLNEGLANSKLGGYFQGIRYTDKYIGELLNTLDENGILDNTVVAIYGDHEGVHKFFNDEIVNLPDKEDWWIENHKKVPFIIYSKDLEGKTVSIHGGQADTFPTLAYLFGANEEDFTTSIMGRNLLNTNKDFVILSDRTYLGKESSPNEKEEMLKSIELSDKLIRANYFKN